MSASCAEVFVPGLALESFLRKPLLVAACQ